eukprot:s1426_g16.t1
MPSCLASFTINSLPCLTELPPASASLDDLGGTKEGKLVPGAIHREIGACACPRAQYLYSLLEVGGILVGPFQSGHSQQLRRVIRESETHFKIEILNSVHFAALIEPPTSTDAGDMEQAGGTPVPPPGTPVVGLPGVPFAFALRQKPWTVERNWAYPHSFRCITAVLLRSKNSSGLLPMELWIEHVLPWCPRWWFDQPSEIMTQKSALAMLGKRMSKVFFSTSTCSTASGISDEAEGAGSGDEVHFTTVTTAPGATTNATAPRAPPRRSMYRIATRAMRRCLRCVARCWTTSRSTPNALQSPASSSSHRTAASKISSRSSRSNSCPKERGIDHEEGGFNQARKGFVFFFLPNMASNLISLK